MKEWPISKMAAARAAYLIGEVRKTEAVLTAYLDGLRSGADVPEGAKYDIKGERFVVEEPVGNETA
jgi:hypothetical protein